jgi:hypothetical protein
LPEEPKFEPIYLSEEEKAQTPGTPFGAQAGLWLILSAIIIGAITGLSVFLGVNPGFGVIVGLFIAIIVASSIVIAISYMAKQGNISRLQERKNKEAQAGFESMCLVAKSTANSLSSTLNGFAQKLSKKPARSKGVKMSVSAPLLRAGFCKNRIFVQSHPKQ